MGPQSNVDSGRSPGVGRGRSCGRVRGRVRRSQRDGESDKQHAAREEGATLTVGLDADQRYSWLNCEDIEDRAGEHEDAMRLGGVAPGHAARTGSAIAADRLRQRTAGKTAVQVERTEQGRGVTETECKAQGPQT